VEVPSSDGLAAAQRRRHGRQHDARRVAESPQAKHKGGGLVERGVKVAANRGEASRLLDARGATRSPQGMVAR
jgi:hypothetical protein